MEDKDSVYEEALKDTAAKTRKFNLPSNDYRDKLKDMSTDRPPPKSGMAQFKPGKTYPGLMPPDGVIEGMERAGKDPNDIIPAALQSRHELNKMDVWNKENPAQRLSARQMIIMLALHELAGDKDNLLPNSPYYPTVEMLRAYLMESGKMEFTEINAITQETVFFLFKRYLNIWGKDSPWPKTVELLKQTKKV